MAFRAFLEELVNNIPGALACLIIDNNGLVISEYHRLTPSDINLLASEYARICRNVSDLMNQLNTGNLKECCFTSEKLSIHVSLVNSSFVMLITLQETARGQALFQLRNLSKRIAL